MGLWCAVVLTRRVFEIIPYFQRVVRYIHQNSERHGVVEDFRDGPYTSYALVQSEADTRLERQQVLDHFGGREAVQQAHRAAAEGEDAVVHPTFEAAVARLHVGRRPRA